MNLRVLQETLFPSWNPSVGNKGKSTELGLKRPGGLQGEINRPNPKEWVPANVPLGLLNKRQFGKTFPLGGLGIMGVSFPIQPFPTRVKKSEEPPNGKPPRFTTLALKWVQPLKPTSFPGGNKAKPKFPKIGEMEKKILGKSKRP